ncbi:MAG: hypothetical protein HZA77_02540 [Candidatus Schekmanbacteria bacterium]|nr:hypothetical protein [Candidatus Schekmanbacteria bacterium]
MYLGIDFLIAGDGTPFISEVNIGLPGGAFEYDVASRLTYGRSSGIYDRIDEIAKKVYGRSFSDYITSTPWFEEHRKFKIWLDRKGPLPQKLYPLFRLEDKWVQYEFLKEKFNLPYSEIYTGKAEQVEKMIERFGKTALKRRAGRWSKGFRAIAGIADLPLLENELPEEYICSQFITSKISDYLFSVRANVFEEEFLCLSGDLTPSYQSKWRFIVAVEEGKGLQLRDEHFETVDVCEPAWEGEVWCKDMEIPEHMKLNLTSDMAALTIAYLTKKTIKDIKETSLKIGKFYDSLDPETLPKAFFEK